MTIDAARPLRSTGSFGARSNQKGEATPPAPPLTYPSSQVIIIIADQRSALTTPQEEETVGQSALVRL